MNKYTKSLLSQSVASKDGDPKPQNPLGHFDVKGVTNRYNKNLNPDSQKAFEYVGIASKKEERALKMRADVLQNKVGFINGRESTRPNTLLVSKMREQASHQELERVRAQSMVDLELKSSRRPLKLKMRDQLMVSKLTKVDNSVSMPSFKHDNSSI